MATSAAKDAKSDPKTAAKPDPKAKQDPKARLEEEVKPEGARPKKKRVWPKFAIMLLVASGVIGAPLWYFLHGEEEPATPVKGAAKGAAAKAPQPAKPPSFLPLDQFTVNLQHENDSQFLQVGLTLRLAEPGYTEAVKTRMPEVRNRVLLLLTSKTANEISTVEGKEKLSNDIQREVLGALGGSVPAQGITGVLFTSFLIQ